MTKVYELLRRNAAYFETKFCGVVVPLSFTMGAGSDGESRAEMVVTDRFTQDAIEHDPRFGKQFVLAATYGEPDPVVEEPKEPKAAPKKKASKVAKADGKVFATLNDAIYYLEEELGIDTDDKDINVLLKENNITVKEK